MKYWMIGLFLLVALLLTGIYFFVPSHVNIQLEKHTNAYENTVLKFLTQSDHLNNWMDRIAEKKENQYQYKGYQYRINKVLSNVVELEISKDGKTYNGFLLPFNIYLDSTALKFTADIETGNNPFTKWSNYQKAMSLKKNAASWLEEMKVYLNETKNVYGFTFKEIQLEDSVLITSRITTNTYPGTAAIYEQVSLLTQYATAQQATPVHHPMLYVKQNAENNTWESMIGLPINKIITDTKDFKIKRMPYGGNMFVTEVTGGPYNIQKGFDALSTYLIDTKRVSPAIPFQILHTDRSKESDTSKWVTRWYYPIM